MSYSDSTHEDMRLRVLQILAAASSYTVNETALKGTLAETFGHALSRDRLRGEMAWLEDLGLLVVQKIGGSAAVWLATLSPRGEDCAAGLAPVPGVARPRAGG